MPALKPRILILCPLAEEWSILVSTFESSHHVERVHDLKIEAAYVRDWRALVTPGGHGKGVVWWYPESIPVPGLAVWGDGSLALFDSTGNVLPAAGVSTGH